MRKLVALAIAALLVGAQGTPPAYGPGAGALACASNPSVSNCQATASGGSASVTMASRFGQSVNVLDFTGVDPTGATASDVGINNAETQACLSTPPKAVFFPPGKYDFKAPLIVTCNNLSLWSYPGTAELTTDAANTGGPFGQAYLIRDVDNLGNNLYVFGLTLDGNKAQQTLFGANPALAFLNQVDNAVFDTVTFQDTYGAGFYTNNTVSNSGVINSVFNDIGQHWAIESAFTQTTSGAAAAGQKIIPFSNTSGMIVGWKVSDNISGIPSDTIISSIVPNTSITVSNNLQGGGLANGATVNFVPPQTDAASGASFCCGSVSSNHDNFVVKSKFTNIGNDSITGASQTRMYIEGNDLQLSFLGWHPPAGLNTGSNGIGAIYQSGNTDSVIKSNRASGATGNGIDLFNQTGAIVIGNQSIGNNGAGLIFLGSGCSVTGNVFKNNYQGTAAVNNIPQAFNAGISTGQSGTPSTLSNCQFSANILTDTQGTPTQLYGFQNYNSSVLTNDVIATSNVFSGNVTAPLSDHACFGNTSACLFSVTANGSSGIVPPNARLRAIYIQETAGHAVTGGIDIGTTNGAADIASAVAVGANGLVNVNTAALLKQWFSTTAQQSVFVSAHTAWNSASVNVEFVYDQ